VKKVTRQVISNQSKYEVLNIETDLTRDDFEDLVKFFKCFKNIRDMKGIQ
jgi:hypothetical protein